MSKSTLFSYVDSTFDPNHYIYMKLNFIYSHVSGVTLLGVPSEIYKYGTQYLIVALTNAISVVIIIYIYLPVFYELQLTSVYEVRRKELFIIIVWFV